MGPESLLCLQAAVNSLLSQLSLLSEPKMSAQFLFLFYFVLFCEPQSNFSSAGLKLTVFPTPDSASRIWLPYLVFLLLSATTSLYFLFETSSLHIVLAVLELAIRSEFAT